MNRVEKLVGFNLAFENLITSISASNKNVKITDSKILQTRFKTLSRKQGLRFLADQRGIKTSRYGSLRMELLLDKGILTQLMLFPYGYGREMLSRSESEIRYPGGPIHYIKDYKRLLLCPWLYEGILQCHFSYVFKTKTSGKRVQEYTLTILDKKNSLQLYTISPELIDNNKFTPKYLLKIPNILNAYNYSFICHYMEKLLYNNGSNLLYVKLELSIDVQDEFHPRHFILASYRYSDIFNNFTVTLFCRKLYLKLKYINLERHYKNTQHVTLYLSIASHEKVTLPDMPLIYDPNYGRIYHIIDDVALEYEYI